MSSCIYDPTVSLSIICFTLALRISKRTWLVGGSKLRLYLRRPMLAGSFLLSSSDEKEDTLTLLRMVVGGLEGVEVLAWY